ncbi:MAG: hypothetical protein HC884_03265 [Chloroflexaceae bacterium]|nr:hypothetical protein [Chloroflexaceae bacterium]
MKQRVTRRTLVLLVIFLALTLGLPGRSSRLEAQTDTRYFAETGHFLRGAFRYFWETNGGPLGSIHTFGYPITEEYWSGTTGRITQYFERARFELVERDGQYGVELGNLGAEATAGRTFETFAPIEPTTQRRFIPQTQHIIQYGFKEIWETHGAERIFGWPISDEIMEVTGDGQMRTVQYFERVRFEYWPEFLPGERVVLTALGRFLAPPELLPPLPPDAAPGSTPSAPQPPAQPAQPATPSGPVLPANSNAVVEPQWGDPGTKFIFEAKGFASGEKVAIWLTAPDGTTKSLKDHASTNRDGYLVDRITIDSDGFMGGVWATTAEGRDSKRTAVAYFQVGGPAPVAAAPVPSQPQGRDWAPANTNASIAPEAGPPGTIFQFDAHGFRKNETVIFWLTTPGGQARDFPGDASASDDGNLSHENIRIDSRGFENGVWAMTAQGRDSKNQSIAYFRIDSAAPAQPTPEVPPATKATGECAENAPTPGEGLHAWMTNDDPQIGHTTRLCVQFVQDGKGVWGAEVRATLRYEETDSDIGPETTNSNGVAELKFRVRDDEDEVDSRVWVDVETLYGGNRYTTRTSFIPRD